MTTQYWLAKSEPDTYSWTDLVRDQRTDWTGVRNYAARNNLKAMQPGDEVLFYHSGDDKSIVGVARVTKAAFPDPTAEEDGWVAVELTPLAALAKPVTLAQVKSESALKEMALVRLTRLSVQPVTAAEFRRIRQLSGAK